MSFSSSGPRTKVTPKRSLRRSRSARQPTCDDLLGHQRSDLHPDVEHLPGEARLHALEHSLEPWAGQMSGEEENAFSHWAVRSVLSQCRLLPRLAGKREGAAPGLTHWR